MSKRPDIKVFISYRRQISDVYAGRLYDRIINRFGDDMKIFIDIDAIAPGLDFLHVIEEAVSSCNVLIAVIGKEWLTITDEEGNRRLDNPEDFVHLEIAAALKRQIRVIPVLVQGATMPTAKDLPEDLQPLRRRNAVSVSNEHWNYDADRMIKAIEDELGIKPPLKYRQIIIGAALASFFWIAIYIVTANTATDTNVNRGNSNYVTNSIPAKHDKNTTYYWGSDKVIIVESDNVTLCSEASSNTGIRPLPNGSKVRLIASQNNWHQVEVVEYKFPATVNPGNSRPSDIGWIYYVLPLTEDTR